MHKKLICTLVTILMLSLGFFANNTEADEYQPWSLRDHFIFTGIETVLKIDPKRAEWRIECSDGKVIIPGAYTELEFADGEVLRLTKDHWVTDGRDPFTDNFGTGDRFKSTFKVKDGLIIEFHLNRYDDQPFMTMMTVVRNTSEQPITLKAIRPGVIPAGQAPLLDAELVTMNNTRRRGSHALPLAIGQSNFMELRMPEGKGLIGIGLLQSGFMQSNLNFIPSAQGGGGRIENTFSPSIDIMPNSTAQTDAIWLLMSMTESASLRDYFTWTTSFIQKEDHHQLKPASWVTIADEEPVETLLETARKWNVKSVNHVLVPGTWQQAGITEGTYAMSIASVSKTIKGSGLIPGITVDPLSAEKDAKSLTLQANDGSYWLDLRNPEARAFGVKQLERLTGWNYQFFVVSMSSIPDDILKTMNITRSVADLVAFEMMTEAAGTFPVFPNSAYSIGNDTKSWQAVERATSINELYQYPTGPIRLDIRNVEQLSSTVQEVVRNYFGPLEIVGLPSKTMQKQLNDTFSVAMVNPVAP
jgi:hypothetical protein